jgi:hypothetical protein
MPAMYRRIRDSKESWDRILRSRGMRKRPPGGGVALPEPVEPKPRRPFSGGAEAPLQFDE